LNKLLIISNPGIYKGSFTHKLKFLLLELNNSPKTVGFNYYMVKNRLFNSLAVFRASNEE